MSREFQFVLIVEHDDGRFIPLTERCPPCLLPIGEHLLYFRSFYSTTDSLVSVVYFTYALFIVYSVGNRPLLRFQLDMIESNGGKEMIIVAPREYRQQLDLFILSLTEVNLKVDLVYVDDMADSADGLRAISDRITSDFIILSTDFMTDLNLGRLTEMHRVKAADLTTLLSIGLIDDTDKKQDDERKRFIINGEDEEIIMMMEDGRVIAKIAPETNQKISTGKYLLSEYNSNVTIRNDLSEIGINMFMRNLLHLSFESSP